MEGMEIIEEVGKGKNFKKFLPFIIAGGALGLFFLLTKGKSETVESQDDTANYVNDSMQKTNQNVESFAGSFNSAIMKQEEDISLLDNNIKNITDMQNSKFNSAIMKQEEDISLLDNNIKNITDMQNSKLDLLQDSIRDIVQTDKTFVPITKEDVQSEIATAIEKIIDVAPIPVSQELPKLEEVVSIPATATAKTKHVLVDVQATVDKAFEERKTPSTSGLSTKSEKKIASDVYTTYQSTAGNMAKTISTAISSFKEEVKKAVTPSTSTPKATTSNPLGNNGEGKRDDVALNAKLQDSNFKKSEIERTKSVIEERKKAGLDTSVQEKYMKEKLGGG